METRRTVALVFPTWVLEKILFRIVRLVGAVAAVIARHAETCEAAVAPVIVPCIETVLCRTLTVAEPPPSKIPAAKSPEVPFAETPEIMLLAINVVPEVADASEIPAAENVPELMTEPITLCVTVAFVTSLPADVVVDCVAMKPIEIPKTSGELACAISLMLLPVIVMLFSNPTKIPPLLTLLGAGVIIAFWLMIFPVFFAPALAPCE